MRQSGGGGLSSFFLVSSNIPMGFLSSSVAGSMGCNSGPSLSSSSYTKSVRPLDTSNSSSSSSSSSSRSSSSSSYYYAAYDC